MVFKNGPLCTRMCNPSGDVYKAVEPKGHRRLLHESAHVTLMAQKDMQVQSYRFLKFQFRIFENLFEKFSKFESPKNLSWCTVTSVKFSDQSVNSNKFDSQLCIFNVIQKNLHVPTVWSTTDPSLRISPRFQRTRMSGGPN